MPIRTRQKRKRVRTLSVESSRKLIEGLSLVQMFERFITYKRTEGLAQRSIDDYVLHFSYLLDYIGEDDLDYGSIDAELFREWIGYMLHDKGLSPVTVNIRIRTMRAFLRFCHREGYLNDPLHERFKQVKTEQDTIESFTPAEVKVLLSQPDLEQYAGFRDFVMMCTLLDTMVRISELVAIKRYNVDYKGGNIKLEAADTKGKKSRTVPLSTKSSKLIKEYMDETEDFYEDTLFITYHGRPILPNSFRERLREYGEKAGIVNRRVSPHTFRHTGALFYVMNGGDPFSLQKILGHSDMTMVRKYIQMTNEDVKRQHNVYSPLRNIRI